MDWGLDLLGIAKYGDLAAREFPAGWWLGAFSSTFGDSRRAVERVVATGRVKGVRIHLGWSDSHSFPVSMFPQLAKEAAKWRPLVNKNPQVQWRLSGGCEHTLDARRAQVLCDLVRQACPEAEYVNSPWQGKGAVLPGVINEVHGARSKPLKGRYQFSFDGDNCVDSDVTALKATHADADVFFLWASQANGRKTTGDKTPRPQRRAWPTSNLIDSWIALSRDRGAVKLPKNWLLKTHADQHSVPPEPRALKPVFIIPVRGKRIELVAENGQVVAVSSRPQAFADGRFRYYIPDFGHIVADKARRIQNGNPVLKVRVDGKVYGTCNPAFRQGSFRAGE
jgi:hypothetical protein